MNWGPLARATADRIRHELGQLDSVSGAEYIRFVANEIRMSGYIQTEAQYLDAQRVIDALLNHCPNAECMECGKIVCPEGEPLHFHHDGCPACD